MQAFILQVPKAHALSQGATPEGDTPFVKQLSARLRAAALNEDAQSAQSRNRCVMSRLNATSGICMTWHVLRHHGVKLTWVSYANPACSESGLGGHLVDTDLPFELRVLEAALDLAGRCFSAEVASLEAHGLPMLDSIAKRVTYTTAPCVIMLPWSPPRLLSSSMCCDLSDR